ncbi:MAG: mandelate racemase/muconate lactonizing enzyme family protein [Planctomycetota bacterium]
MPKITDVRNVPLRVLQEVGALEPAWEPGASMAFRRGGSAVLEIHTDDGRVGIGPGLKQRVLDVVRPVLLGQDAAQVEELFERMRFAMRDRPGMAGADVALWDLRARCAGVPLHRLWGSARDRVPAYASLIRLSTPQERAEQAARLVQQGWRALKLRLHHETMKRDIETVAAVRAVVGERMAILCDANQAQSPGAWQPGVRWDFERALHTARELQQLGCGWLEEPLPRYAFADLRRLSDKVDLPIAAGENLRLPDFEALCSQQVVDVVQPDAMVLDGLTALLQVGALTQQHGLSLAPHHGGRGLGTIAHLHAVAALPHARFVEVLHDPPIGDCAHGFSILRQAPQLDGDGNLVLPSGPGLGVDVDPGLIDRGA